MPAAINPRGTRRGHDPLGYKDTPPRRQRKKSAANPLRTFGSVMLKGVLPLGIAWWALSPMFTNATSSDVYPEETMTADSVEIITSATVADAVAAETPEPAQVSHNTSTSSQAAPSAPETRTKTAEEPDDNIGQPALSIKEALSEIDGQAVLSDTRAITDIPSDPSAELPASATLEEPAATNE